MTSNKRTKALVIDAFWRALKGFAVLAGGVLVMVGIYLLFTKSLVLVMVGIYLLFTKSLVLGLIAIGAILFLLLFLEALHDNFKWFI